MPICKTRLTINDFNPLFKESPRRPSFNFPLRKWKRQMEEQIEQNVNLPAIKIPHRLLTQHKVMSQHKILFPSDLTHREHMQNHNKMQTQRSQQSLRQESPKCSGCKKCNTTPTHYYMLQVSNGKGIMMKTTSNVISRSIHKPQEIKPNWNNPNEQNGEDIKCNEQESEKGNKNAEQTIESNVETNAVVQINNLQLVSSVAKPLQVYPPLKLTNANHNKLLKLKQLKELMTKKTQASPLELVTKGLICPDPNKRKKKQKDVRLKREVQIKAVRMQIDSEIINGWDFQ